MFKRFLSCLALIACVACYPVQPDTDVTDPDNGTGQSGDNPGGGTSSSDEEPVSTVKVNSLSLNPADIYLCLGSKTRVPVHCTVDPAAAKSGLVWTSSDPSIVKVLDDCLLPMKLGTATISAKAANMSATCVAHVVDKAAGCVDMGLSVLWAECNLGASTPSDKGDYYAWGELRPKDIDYYNWKHYRFATKDGSDYRMTRYTAYDNKTQLQYEDDAAWYALGGGWRIPSEEECHELYVNTTRTRTTKDGVDGILFTSKINGNTLFFPLAGYIESSSVSENLKYGGQGALIWTRDLNKDTWCRSAKRYVIACYSGNLFSWGLRYCGHNIRPVFK